MSSSPSLTRLSVDSAPIKLIARVLQMLIANHKIRGVRMRDCPPDILPRATSSPPVANCPQAYSRYLLMALQQKRSDGDVPSEPTREELPECPANSLFVANLPHRLSNQTLTLTLHSCFRQFGRLRLIRASRDPRNRPFGFVDFWNEADAQHALAVCSQHYQQSSKSGTFGNGQLLVQMSMCCAQDGCVMCIEGRPVRVEMARFQARLAVTCSDKGVLEDTLRLLEEYDDKSIRIQSRGRSGQSLAVHFNDRQKALRVHDALVRLDGIQCVWMSALQQPKIQGSGYPMPTSNSIATSSVRSSGLVQYCPDAYGISQADSLQKRPGPYTFEDEQITDASRALGEVYVGRLCGWRVNRDLLKERFGQYGQLAYVRLFNRGVVKADAPVDAFAHIGFVAGAEPALRAVALEDGQCWLGQVITVQPLIQSRAMKLCSAVGLDSIDAAAGEKEESADDFEIIL